MSDLRKFTDGVIDILNFADKSPISCIQFLAIQHISVSSVCRFIIRLSRQKEAIDFVPDYRRAVTCSGAGRAKLNKLKATASRSPVRLRGISLSFEGRT